MTHIPISAKRLSSFKIHNPLNNTSKPAKFSILLLSEDTFDLGFKGVLNFRIHMTRSPGEMLCMPLTQTKRHSTCNSRDKKKHISYPQLIDQKIKQCNGKKLSSLAYLILNLEVVVKISLSIRDSSASRFDLIDHLPFIFTITVTWFIVWFHVVYSL